MRSYDHHVQAHVRTGLQLHACCSNLSVRKMRSVLLCYGERKKVVVVPEDKDSDDISYLDAEFRKHFDYESNVSITVSFQKWDPTWSEYVELDKAAAVEDKDKLNVVVTPRLVTPTTSRTSDDLQCKDDPRSSLTEQSLDSTPSGALEHLPRRRLSNSDDSDGSESICSHKRGKKRSRQVLDSDSDDTVLEDNGDVTPKEQTTSKEVGDPNKRRKSVEKSEEDAVPLPDPFPLPKHYSVDVETGLKSKSLSDHARKAFINKVASAMLFYKRYPTSEDYTNVGRSVIQKYPFLKSPFGTPAVS